jgi:SAM-dependent MidA family methyltransferase
MPDTDFKPPSSDGSCSENYPNPGNSATPSSVCEWITGRGGVPFPEYMEMVLYDPELGYYAKSHCQVGRSGDFYTSVSVGPLFGRLLARRFAKGWDDAGKPASWRILEIGAHDGKLAADILTEIRTIRPDAWESLEYAIAEPLHSLRESQHDRLEGLAQNLRIVANLAEFAGEPLPGFAFGNEILDALPFHLVEMSGGNWKQLHVCVTKGKLSMQPRKIDPESLLATSLGNLGNEFPEGYRTEIRTGFGSFLGSISSCLVDGTMLFADYGFAAPEYYDRLRTTGTLRTFYKHTAGEDPLDSPGERDITAHVDFTCLAKSAEPLDYRPTVFCTQESYLTHLAKPMMMAGELNDEKSIAQFKSLTHPAHLGASFHMIELSIADKTPPGVKHRLAL